MLKVFDKNLVPTGQLPYADQVQRKRRLNSNYELSFLVPMDSDDYTQKIQLKGHVQDEKGQYYVINSRKRDRTGLKRMVLITCTHIMFKMTDFLMPYASYLSEGYGVNIITLTNLITAATNGKFAYSIDDVFDVKDVKDFGRGNAMEAHAYVIKTYDAEADPNNLLIHLKKKIGVNNGLQYRFKKNIISDSFTDSTQGLVTRMYGQMKDGLTFIGLSASNLTAGELSLLSAIPGAISGGLIQVNYLISQYASTWSNTTNAYFDGEHIDQNITDQLQLLVATRKALAENEVPSIDVTINSADLFKIDNTEPKPDMGDTVYLIDPLMDLNNMTARVVDITEYPYQLDKHTQVTLANYMLTDYKDIIASLDTSKRVVDNLISGGQVRTSLFELSAKQAITDINNSKTQIIYDTRGIVLKSVPTPTHQVVLSAEGIYLSTDAGASTLYAITANGIIADRIIGTIGSFVNISATSIVTGSLNGINMQIGSGSSAFHADASGISLGGISWGLSPFRVDMAGNAWATSMTLSQPSITNGHIIGTDINIGSGQFTVSAAGAMVANSATIHGDITSGSTITGAVIKTASGLQRIQIDSTYFTQYNLSGNVLYQIGNYYNYPRTDYNDPNLGYAQASIYSNSGFHVQANNFPMYIDAGSSSLTLTGNSGITFYGGIVGSPFTIANVNNLQNSLDALSARILYLENKAYVFSHRGTGQILFDSKNTVNVDFVTDAS